jgi:hypothetical protein
MFDAWYVACIGNVALLLDDAVACSPSTYFTIVTVDEVAAVGVHFAFHTMMYLFDVMFVSDGLVVDCVLDAADASESPVEYPTSRYDAPVAQSAPTTAPDEVLVCSLTP